jgi:hypothetical protein
MTIVVDRHRGGIDRRLQGGGVVGQGRQAEGSPGRGHGAQQQDQRRETRQQGLDQGTKGHGAGRFNARYGQPAGGGARLGALAVHRKAGGGWFAYVRIYGPSEPHLSKTWQLNDSKPLSAPAP